VDSWSEDGLFHDCRLGISRLPMSVKTPNISNHGSNPTPEGLALPAQRPKRAASMQLDNLASSISKQLLHETVTKEVGN